MPALTAARRRAMKCVDPSQHNETGNEVYAPADGGKSRIALRGLASDLKLLGQVPALLPGDGGETPADPLRA
jgi:hypothetical protein